LLAPVKCSLLELSGYLQPLLGEIWQSHAVIIPGDRFTTEDAGARAQASQAHRRSAESSERDHRPDGYRAIAAVPGAKLAPFPDSSRPATRPCASAPDGPGWLHEIKIDGYRAQVHLHHGRVIIYSRSGYNWTDHFHQIAQAVKEGHRVSRDGRPLGVRREAPDGR
jgi:ATP-dependent DNA ligase